MSVEMKVPLLDLTAQFESIRDELMPAIEAVIQSQSFINGPEVGQLEQQMADYTESAAAIGVSSGTDALIVSLMTLGIGAGDEVITTPYTFFATAGSIWRVGAKPVFVDIEPDTFNIDTRQIEAAITERTKAIIPVHLFGQTAEMDPILELAARHDLVVIEDAAQAIGARYHGRSAGSMGTIGCFSFFPSKNLGAMGDGGLVVTQDAQLGARLLQCRNHGSSPKYYHAWVGGNFRLDTIQAAALIVKLRYLERWHQARRANAALYDALLADVEGVVTPVVRPYNDCIYNQYVVRVPRRDACQKTLADRGIGSAVYYPLSLHQQECFASLGYGSGDFPESERAAAETLALPIDPELDEQQIRHVANAIGEFVAAG